MAIYRIKRFSCISEKEFTRKEKELIRQYMKRTKGHTKMPKGITSVEDSDNLMSVTRKLREGAQIDKAGRPTINLTEAERKTLRKQGLSKAAEGDTLDRISWKYSSKNPAWERLKRMKKGNVPEEYQLTPELQKIDKKSDVFARLKSNHDQMMINGKNHEIVENKFKLIENKINEDVANEVHRHNSRINEQMFTPGNIYEVGENRMTNAMKQARDAQTASDRKLAQTLKRTRRKSGTSVLELNGEEFGDFSVGNQRVKEHNLRSSLGIGSGDLGEITEGNLGKYNARQIKSLKKGKTKNIIGTGKTSAPEIIEHEAGHNSINSIGTAEQPSNHRVYNRFVKNLDEIAEENGASARALHNLRNQPGAARRKKHLNSAIGTYFNSSKVELERARRGYYGE